MLAVLPKEKRDSNILGEGESAKSSLLLYGEGALVRIALFFGPVHSCRRSNNRLDSPIRRHLLSLQQAGNGINQQLLENQKYSMREKSTNLALLSAGVYLVIMYAGLGGVGGWGAPNLRIISCSLERAPQQTKTKIVLVAKILLFRTGE